MAYLLRRLRDPEKIKKLFIERLTEPVHLNLLSAFVAAFGSYRAKVAFDLVVRQQYAFPILAAAEHAREIGIDRLTLIEFGVASGAGLLNMCDLADRTAKATGVRFEIFGFNLGTGMPAAIDYRDLPESFQLGDFKMDRASLEGALPDNAKLVIGPINDTVPEFLKSRAFRGPIGFVSIDVDYYSSATAALRIFEGDPQSYLPIVPVYLDDISVSGSNPWTGEWLAMNEFNQRQKLRKIAPYTLLRAKRIFKNPIWIDMMYACHVHDHPVRAPGAQKRPERVIRNEYIE